MVVGAMPAYIHNVCNALFRYSVQQGSLTQESKDQVLGEIDSRSTNKERATVYSTEYTS